MIHVYFVWQKQINLLIYFIYIEKLPSFVFFCELITKQYTFKSWTVFREAIIKCKKMYISEMTDVGSSLLCSIVWKSSPVQQRTLDVGCRLLLETSCGWATLHASDALLETEIVLLFGNIVRT